MTSVYLVSGQDKVCVASQQFINACALASDFLFVHVLCFFKNIYIYRPIMLSQSKSFRNVFSRRIKSSKYIC